VDYEKMARELYAALATIVGDEPEMMSAGYGKPQIRISGLFDLLSVGEDVNAGVDLIKKYKGCFDK